MGVCDNIRKKTSEDNKPNIQGEGVDNSGENVVPITKNSTNKFHSNLGNSCNNLYDSKNNDNSCLIKKSTNAFESRIQTQESKNKANISLLRSREAVITTNSNNFNNSIKNSVKNSVKNNNPNQLKSTLKNTNQFDILKSDSGVINQTMIIQEKEPENNKNVSSSKSNNTLSSKNTKPIYDSQMIKQLNENNKLNNSKSVITPYFDTRPSKENVKNSNQLKSSNNDVKNSGDYKIFSSGEVKQSYDSNFRQSSDFNADNSKTMKPSLNNELKSALSIVNECESANEVTQLSGTKNMNMFMSGVGDENFKNNNVNINFVKSSHNNFRISKDGLLNSCNVNFQNQDTKLPTISSTVLKKFK